MKIPIMGTDLEENLTETGLLEEEVQDQSRAFFLKKKRTEGKVR